LTAVECFQLTHWGQAEADIFGAFPGHRRRQRRSMGFDSGSGSVSGSLWSLKYLSRSMQIGRRLLAGQHHHQHPQLSPVELAVAFRG